MADTTTPNLGLILVEVGGSTDTWGPKLNFDFTTLDTAVAGKQAASATLTALATATPAADKLLYATSGSAFATTTFTAFARTLLDDVDAATMRATLGAAAASHAHAISEVTGLQGALDGKQSQLTYGTADPGALAVGAVYGKHV